ncbi:MAG: hypothetical protein DMF93_22605 [Acidobacteria bacterium]|nr:MAG: hypothetical protein DMF93_22605 [Acidobacteriota bacterium]
MAQTRALAGLRREYDTSAPRTIGAPPNPRKIRCQRGANERRVRGSPFALPAADFTASARPHRKDSNDEETAHPLDAPVRRRRRERGRSGPTQLSDLGDKQVKAAVDAELVKKGLSRTDAESADLYIGYQAGIGQEKEYTSFDSGWGYGPGYGRGWYGGGGGMTTGSTSTIYIGQLALDMYASSPKTLVFRTVASKTLDTEAKPEKQQKNLAKAVTKMLKNYPPAPKEKT